MQPYDNLTIELSGSNLIEASAGTGKTFAIACLVLRLVVEQGLLPENVLVVTFTEAATKELRGRVRERLRSCRDFFADSGPGDEFCAALLAGANPWWPGRATALERLERALQTFDSAAIFTIHGFCARALQEHAFESGSLYDTELLADQGAVVRELVEDFWRATFFRDEAPLLATVLVKRWLLDDMVRFLGGKLTNPELLVVPEFTAEQVARCDRDCREAYRELAALWAAEGGAVTELLAGHPGLSRAKDTYRADLLPELLDNMAAYLAAGNPCAIFAGLEKFSTGFMERQALKRTPPPRHRLFDCCGELLAALDQRFVALKGELLQFVRQGLARVKAERNVRFYDDLLLDLYRALAGPSGAELATRLRHRYRAALIDEFQDTDPVQYRIFRQVFGAAAAPLFLIGDPKQAIYSFRGADIFAYLEARAHVTEERRFTMDRNWRSAPEMVAAVSALFSQQPQRPFIFPAIAYPPVAAAREQQPLQVAGRDPAPLQLWFLKRQATDKQVIGIGAAQARIVQLLAAEISGLLADGRSGRALLDGRGVAPADVAVLVRSHGQAALVQQALRARQIPAVVQGAASLFAGREAAALHRVLLAVAEPGSEPLVRAALATVLFGMSGNAIAALGEDGPAWEQRLAAFAAYHDLWRQRGFMVFFRSLLSREGVRERVLALLDGERSLTNLLHCGEVLHQAALAGTLGVDALCAWFGERVSVPPDNEEYQIRLESDEAAVRIVTIHVSKGLEYPIVFCPFSWGGVFADGDTVVCHDGFRQVVDFGSADLARHRHGAATESLAENLRLLYVALTRAKYRCYLVWGRFRHTESSAPAYLLHGSDADAADPVDRLAAVVKDLGDEAMIDRLATLAAAHPGSMALGVDPEPVAAVDDGPAAPAPPPRFTPFTGVIARDWRVASFSSLVAGHRDSAELPDHDQAAPGAAVGADGEADGEAEPAVAPAGSMFAFPRGAAAGVLLHDVLEQLDFSADDGTLEQLVAALLDRHGFAQSWRPAVCAMVRRVLTAPLPAGDRTLHLGGLAGRDRLTELEFFFPLALVESPQLARILGRWQGVAPEPDLGALARQLQFNRVRGMVRGFMDLVFRQGGKYYILDWKSNHLGNSWDAYRQPRLAAEMDARFYHFQYLLYTVALDRYLSRRDPDYRYASHFGGCLYLFLRGIEPTRPGNGVYFQLPPEELVRELRDCLLAEGEVC